MDAETNTEFEPTAESIEAQEERAIGDLEREHYEEIRDLERIAYAAQIDYEEAKAESDARKKTLNRHEAALRACIRRGPDTQGKLPFREDWRDVPVEEALNVTEKQLEKLHECGVKTVGEFEELRAGQMSDYPRGLLSVKGFGESFVDAVENDIIEWLANNQDLIAEGENDEPEEADDGDAPSEGDE